MLVAMAAVDRDCSAGPPVKVHAHRLGLRHCDRHISYCQLNLRCDHRDLLCFGGRHHADLRRALRDAHHLHDDA